MDGGGNVGRKISVASPSCCECGWSGERFYSESNGWKDECPECHRTLEYGVHAHKPKLTDYGGDTRFSGDMQHLISIAFHPDEVEEGRKLVGDLGRVDDSGQVFVRKGSDAKKLIQKFQERKRLGEAMYAVREAQGGRIQAAV